jgi:hypothetical protein
MDHLQLVGLEEIILASGLSVSSDSDPDFPS